MGLLVECPECKKRNSQKFKGCACGFALAKFSGRVYWIEWYQDGQRRRERIGPNKAAAEQRLREIKSALTEGRHIKKNPDARTRFKDLASWYLNLPEVKAKCSHYRDKMAVNNLLPFFGDRLLRDITPSLVETFKQKRLNEPTKKRPQFLTKPASVNREVSCMGAIFNKAIKNGKAERNPVQGVKLLRENNERDRLLSPDEYARLMATCPPHLKPIVRLAYHTGLRRGEILGLTWGQVDVKEGFIRLNPEHTKTNEGRLVPLNGELLEMFKAMPRGLPGVKVFTYRGLSMGSFWRGFQAACRRAKVEDFTFHDLRHTAINNWRLAGHDYFRIMAATGHKTMGVFKRYNTVSKDELKALVGEKI